MTARPRFVGQGRLELPTSRLSGVRSNHLSYWPWWQASRARSLKTELLNRTLDGIDLECPLDLLPKHSAPRETP